MPQAFNSLLPIEFWKSVHNLLRNRVFPEKCTFGHSQPHVGLMCGAMLNITSQWQDPEIWTFFVMGACDDKKNRSHSETTCAQISYSSIGPFKEYRRKTSSGENHTDSNLFSDLTRHLRPQSLALFIPLRS